MAGRLGNKKTTTQNLLVLKIDEDNNLLIVKGSVPGHKGSLVKIVDSVKKNQNIAELIGSQTLKNTDTEQTTEISSVENKDDINPNTKNEENQAKDSTVEGKTLSKTVDTTNESCNKNTSSDVNKDNTKVRNMKHDVSSLDNKKVKDLNLDKEIFGVELKEDIIYRMIRYQLAKRRSWKPQNKRYL